MDRGAQDEVRLALPVLDLKSLFLSDNKRFFYFRGRKYKTTILYITIVSQVAAQPYSLPWGREEVGELQYFGHCDLLCQYSIMVGRLI